MAIVRLHVSETTEGDLPNVCMMCGQPATTHIRRIFSWCPPWVPILILPGLLIYVIVASILTKRMNVAVPVCNRHRGYWIKHNLLIWLPILVLGGLGVSAVIVLSNERQTRDLTRYACVGLSVVFLVWLIAAAVITRMMVRPTEITDRGITLTNVHIDFEFALDEMGRRERQRAPDYRDRPRRLARDDYDEDDRPRRRDNPYDDRPRRADDRGPVRPPPLPPDAFRDDQPRRPDEGDPGQFR